MARPTHNAATLLLEDGTVFYGNAAGKIGTTVGELCFNTGMTGYQEIFTDPSYYGQLLVMTNAHIGNYGTKRSESESSRVKIAGMICKNFNPEPSRTQADLSLEAYLIEQHIVGIADLDTRAVVRHIRSKGAMNAIISSEITDIDLLQTQLAAVPNMEGLELASVVSTPTPYFVGKPDARFKVAVFDYGVKQSILQNLANRGCYLQVFPARTPYEIAQAWQPDGFFLSNGPGDPAPMDYAIAATKAILAADQPLFGICLGHQILALACDIPTYKMHHGHRGINHPVINLTTGKSEITSQNHGFGVNPDVIRAKSGEIEITHINLNDNTIEGMRLKHKSAFSVQYHPEASPGPHDSRYLFDQFMEMMAQQTGK